MLFKRKEKVKKSHPTKEEYEKSVILDQQKELESGRFQTLEAYLGIFEESSHLEKQEYLLSLIGNYNDDHIDEINNGYFYTKTKKFKKYSLLKDFIESLTEEECEENYYLFLAQTLFNIIKKECDYYIMYYSNNKDNNKRNYQEFTFDLSKEITDIVPNAVPLTVAHQYYMPQRYSISYDPILPNSHIQVYYDFNSIVRTIQKMLSDIIDLELWHQFDKMGVEVAVSYINTLINDDEKSITICFNDPIITSRKRNWLISDGSVELLSKYFEKSFDDIISMDYDDLKEFLDESQAKLKKTN